MISGSAPQFRPQLVGFPDQNIRFQVESVSQQKNRAEAGLSLGSLQKRKSCGVESRAFGKRLVREALFSSEMKQDVGEGLGCVQAFILGFGLPN